MWEISVNGQITAVIYSLVLGAVLGIFYDIIRVFRKTGLNSFAAVFICDVFFFAVSAVVTFIFLVGATNGEIRGYVIFSCAVGFIVYRLTLSKVVFYLICKLFGLISFVTRLISLLFLDFLRICEIPVSFMGKGLKHAGKRIFSALKKLLKNVRVMLYTMKDRKDLEYDADEQG